MYMTTCTSTCSSKLLSYMEQLHAIKGTQFLRYHEKMQTNTGAELDCSVHKTNQFDSKQYNASNNGTPTSLV